MAARRLMIVMLVLLGVSLITATLVPVPDRGSTTSTSSTTTTTTEAASQADSGRVIERTIRTRTGKPEQVRVTVGDQLRLTVRAPHPDEVELAGLGELAYVDAYDPAVFDLRPFEPGIHAVRLLNENRVIGRLEVLDRPLKG